MAARSKFTEQRVATFLEGIAAGMSLTGAAGRAGVGRQAIYEWLARGEKQARGSYRDFLEAYQAANAKVEEEAVGELRAAGRDDWRAAVTYLERRHPDEWSKRERHEVSGPKGEPIRVELKWPTGPAPPE